MTIREEAMMILSACACNRQDTIGSAAWQFDARSKSERLAFLSSYHAWLRSPITNIYAEAEAMLACGWTP